MSYEWSNKNKCCGVSGMLGGLFFPYTAQNYKTSILCKKLEKIFKEALNPNFSNFTKNREKFYR